MSKAILPAALATRVVALATTPRLVALALVAAGSVTSGAAIAQEEGEVELRRTYVAIGHVGHHAPSAGHSAEHSGCDEVSPDGLQFSSRAGVEDEAATDSQSAAVEEACSATYTNSSNISDGSETATMTFAEDLDGPQLNSIEVTGSGVAERSGADRYTRAAAHVEYRRGFLSSELGEPVQKLRLTGSISGTTGEGDEVRVTVSVGGSDYLFGEERLRGDFSIEFDEEIVVGGGEWLNDFHVAVTARTDGLTLDSSEGHASFELALKLDAGSAVAITASPPALSNLRNARFEFAALADGAEGSFECRLDEEGEFEACESPQEYGDLSDGGHVFEVRHVALSGGGTPEEPDDPSPGAATRYEWLVDTIEPSATIDSGPAGDVASQSAEIAFSGDDGDGSGVAGFLCRVDDGEEFACASPERLTGLAEGHHRFDVRAVDAAGNIGEAAVRSWAVVGERITAVACPGSALSRIAFGPVVALARESSGCFEERGGRRVAAGRVSINGILVEPKGATQVVVDAALGSGTIAVTGPARLSIGGVGFDLAQPFKWTDLGSSVGTAGGVARRGLSDQLAEATKKIAGVQIKGGVDFELSASDEGTAKLSMILEVPRPLQATPGASSGTESMAIGFDVSTSNAKGPMFTGRWKISLAHLGKVKLKDIDVALFHDPSRPLDESLSFDGSAVIEAGKRAFSDTQLKVGVKIGPDGIWNVLHRMSVEVSGIEKHLSHGIFFQRVAGAFEKDGGRAKLSTEAGLSWAPKLKFGPFEGYVAALDGTVSVSWPFEGDGPLTLQAEGKGKLVEIPVADASLEVASSGLVTLGGKLDFSVAGYGYLAQVTDTFFDAATVSVDGTRPPSFNVSAKGDYRPLGFTEPIEVETVVSKVGAAACFTHDGFELSFGWGKRWGEAYTPLGAGGTCDVAPFKHVAGASHTRAAQVQVKRGTRALVLSAKAAGGPPKVALEGPGEVRLLTPEGPQGVRERGRLVIQNPADDSTFMAVARPRPGAWRLTSLDGRRVETAFSRDVPPIRARVRVAGRGAKRMLKWRTTEALGQSLTFTESGRGTAHTILTTRRARGRARFRPHPHPARSRRIGLLVERNGLPRASLGVARYTAPRLPRLRRATRIRLERDRRTITWRHQRAAAEYVVAVGLRNGTVRSYERRRARHRLPRRLGRRHRATITVVAVGRDGRTARAVTRTVKPVLKRRGSRGDRHAGG